MQIVESDTSASSSFTLMLFDSPITAYSYMNPQPDDCVSGLAAQSGCAPLDVGDVAPPGFGHSHRGVIWNNGQYFAWTRGCYLFYGGTDWPELKDKAMGYALQVDAQLSASPCAGCADANACQSSGSGSGSGTGSGTGSSTSPCGPGVPAPAGPFAVSGYGCQYEEASDGVRCAAMVMNACPGAELEYEWRLDGVVVPGFAGEVFSPTGLGLCAGEHTVLVSARDTKNNLTAPGMSWTFTSTLGPPCGTGSGGSLAVATPACNYLSTEDRIMCLTQVSGAPAGAEIEYEWTWNGTVQAETGSLLDLMPVSPAFKIHSFQVRARDKVSGQTTAIASTTLQVGSPPLVTREEYIRVETPSDAFEFDWSGGSTPQSLLFSESDLMTRVLAKCPELGLILLVNLRYDTTLADIYSSIPSPAEAVVASLLLKCAGLVAEGPAEIAAVGDTGGFLPAQTAPEELPVQLRIDMLRGPLHVEVVSDQVLLDVQTSEASVRSAGQNEFGVAFDSQTGNTTVTAYSGGVEVYSMRDGLQVAALGEGDQVTVSQGKASQVMPTSTSEGTSGTALAVLGCLAGLAVLAGLVIWAIVRSRKKKGAAPTRAAVPGPAVSTPPAPVVLRPAPGTPAAPAAPRLVVAAGKASAAVADLSRGLVTIGRHPSSTLVVYDALVSDQHAQVGYQNGFWVVIDLGSRNGTFLNGVRIQRQALRPGDRIQVGQTVLVFQVGA